jgi:hypothetical protein
MPRTGSSVKAPAGASREHFCGKPAGETDLFGRATGLKWRSERRYSAGDGDIRAITEIGAAHKNRAW